MTGKELKAKILAEIERLITDLGEQRDVLLEELKDFINSLPEEPVSDDLEESARNYGDELDNVLTVGIDDDNTVGEYAQESFKAGALWQKEQMMKDAVSGAFIRRNKYTKRNVLSAFDIICDEIQKFKDKDHVKVIIIKDE